MRCVYAHTFIDAASPSSPSFFYNLDLYTIVLCVNLQHSIQLSNYSVSHYFFLSMNSNLVRAVSTEAGTEQTIASEQVFPLLDLPSELVSMILDIVFDGVRFQPCTRRRGEPAFWTFCYYDRKYPYVQYPRCSKIFRESPINVLLASRTVYRLAKESLFRQAYIGVGWQDITRRELGRSLEKLNHQRPELLAAFQRAEWRHDLSYAYSYLREDSVSVPLVKTYLPSITLSISPTFCLISLTPVELNLIRLIFDIDRDDFQDSTRQAKFLTELKNLNVPNVEVSFLVYVNPSRHSASPHRSRISWPDICADPDPHGRARAAATRVANFLKELGVPNVTTH